MLPIIMHIATCDLFMLFMFEEPLGLIHYHVRSYSGVYVLCTGILPRSLCWLKKAKWFMLCSSVVHSDVQFVEDLSWLLHGIVFTSETS